MSDLPWALSLTINLSAENIEETMDSYRESSRKLCEVVTVLRECCTELEAGVPRLKKAIENWLDHDEEFANEAGTFRPSKVQPDRV